MARMALEESQDFSWVAKGWEVMSFFVFFLYASKAAEKIVSKFVEYVEVDRAWDIVYRKELVGFVGEKKKVAGNGRNGADSDSRPVNYASCTRRTATLATCNAHGNSQPEVVRCAA